MIYLCRKGDVSVERNSIQPDKQKNLLSQASLNYNLLTRRKGAVGQASCLHDVGSCQNRHGFDFYQEPPALPNHHFLDETNSDVRAPWTWSKLQARVEAVRNKIKSCPGMGFARWVCSDCGEIVSKESYKLTCGLRYCKNPDCVRARIRKNKIRLHNYKIFSKRLIHFEVGFPYVSRLTKQAKKVQEAVLRALTEEMKRLGTPISALRIFDIAEHEGSYFLHYHYAQMPVKDYMQFVKNTRRARLKVMEKTGQPLIIHFEGWREKRSLFSYFAKRMSGVYGDVLKNNRFNLADIISIKEYAQDFFNIRSFVIIGMQPRAKRGNVLNIVLSKPSECPFCGCKKLLLIPEELIQKPPDKTCSECGLEVSPKDFSFSEAVCKWCTFKKTSKYKVMKKQEEFEAYLNVVSKSDHSHEAHKSARKVGEVQLAPSPLLVGKINCKGVLDKWQNKM